MSVLEYLIKKKERVVEAEKLEDISDLPMYDWYFERNYHGLYNAFWTVKQYPDMHHPRSFIAPHLTKFKDYFEDIIYQENRPSGYGLLWRDPTKHFEVTQERKKFGRHLWVKPTEAVQKVLDEYGGFSKYAFGVYSRPKYGLCVIADETENMIASFWLGMMEKPKPEDYTVR